MKLSPVKVLIMLIACAGIFVGMVHEKSIFERKPQLKFRADGTFKIVQFADIQDGANTDKRTINLMNKILDLEKPDLVVLTGDNVNGSPKTQEEVRKAIDNIAQPMEKRHIPWAIVLGNHDEDHHQMTKAEMMKFYRSYPYNLSSPGPKDIGGIGNYNLLINDSRKDKPVFNIYLLDSGSYAPGDIGGYDWIKFSQIDWYRKTTLDLKERYGKSIPALMFFHIPIPEFRQVWNSGKAVGEKHQDECISNLNSGLFTSLIEMGDVKGVFVGHDHVNDYVGELYGIKLGYSRNIGYSTYGEEGFARGGRVFLINEADPAQFQTWMRLASDFQ